jgi:hypothetical protein
MAKLLTVLQRYKVLASGSLSQAVDRSLDPVECPSPASLIEEMNELMKIRFRSL